MGRVNVSPLRAQGLPTNLESLDRLSHLSAEDLWEWARAYNRLRRKHLYGKLGHRCAQLKTRCVVLAVVRRPDLFLHFLDPNTPRFRLFYQIEARTLLHLPAGEWLEVMQTEQVVVKCPE